MRNCYLISPMLPTRISTLPLEGLLRLPSGENSFSRFNFWEAGLKSPVKYIVARLASIILLTQFGTVAENEVGGLSSQMIMLVTWFYLLNDRLSQKYKKVILK